jgi:hypothetical protein
MDGPSNGHLAICMAITIISRRGIFTVLRSGLFIACTLQRRPHERLHDWSRRRGRLLTCRLRGTGYCFGCHLHGPVILCASRRSVDTRLYILAASTPPARQNQPYLYWLLPARFVPANGASILSTCVVDGFLTDSIGRRICVSSFTICCCLCWSYFC